MASSLATFVASRSTRGRIYDPHRPGLRQEKAPFAPAVGLAVLDLLNLCTSAYEQVRANANAYDEQWNDYPGARAVRQVGRTIQAVAVCLFPELRDAWADSIAAAEQAVDPSWPGLYNPVWPRDPPEVWDGSMHWSPDTDLAAIRFVMPHDPRSCSWNADPAAFRDQVQATQIALRVKARLSWDFDKPEPPTEWNASTANPPPMSAPIQAAYDEVRSALDSAPVRTIMDAIGWSSDSYSIPVLGWMIAALDLIIEVAYAIFGTASGEEYLGDQYLSPPFNPGELQNWDTFVAAVLLILRELLQECRFLSGLSHKPLREQTRWLGPSARPAPPSPPTPPQGSTTPGWPPPAVGWWPPGVPEPPWWPPTPTVPGLPGWLPPAPPAIPGLPGWPGASGPALPPWWPSALPWPTVPPVGPTGPQAPAWWPPGLPQPTLPPLPPAPSWLPQIPGWPPVVSGAEPGRDAAVADTDPWWEMMREPLPPNHPIFYGMTPAEIDEARGVGFAPVQLANYFTKAANEIDQLDSDNRAKPPKKPTEEYFTWLGEWQAFVNSPVAAPELSPPSGWRAFKNAWDTTETYLFYSDEWVMERIEKYERRFLELFDRFVALGGTVTVPRPTVGPPASDWDIGSTSSKLDGIIAIGLLLGAGYLISQVRGPRTSRA